MTFFGTIILACATVVAVTVTTVLVIGSITIVRELLKP